MDRRATLDPSPAAARARAGSRSKKLFESEKMGVDARRRAGAATSLGFRRGDVVVASRESLDVADASRAMSLLESTVARAEVKVALRTRDASREDVAAVEEALDALDLVVRARGVEITGEGAGEGARAGEGVEG